ncbi:MAG: SurA N-terminal domain-containing protein [Cocleimonas sp.]
MLQNIHDKAKGWVAYVIVGFIAIPFALFGISSYLSGGSALVAATVNGEEIPARGMRSTQLLNQVINQTLIQQVAAENGYRASNQEVYDILSSDPAFQKEGVFDAQTYEFSLASRRTNKANYENDLRARISNSQFIQAINSSAFISPQKLTRYQGLFNQTRDVEVFTLKMDDYKSEVNVSEDEIKTQYDANNSQYMTDEKVKLSYVKLSQDELAKDVAVDEDALKLFYDDNADRYVDPEQRSVAHILIKIDGEDAKAKEKAEALLKKINDGVDTFENLAKTESADTLTAKKSGELGFVARGDMGKLFDDGAFKLAKGDVSEVIKTNAGYEIIKLLDIKEKNQKDFADVTAEVEKLYRKEEAIKVFFDKSEKLQTLAFENEGSLDEAADAIGVQVLSTDWMVRNQPFDPKSPLVTPKILKAAFSDDVLAAGKNSEMIEVGNGVAYVVRLADHELPTVRPLTEVTETIKASLVAQKLRKVVVEKGESALEKIKLSGDWSAIESIGGSVDNVVKTAAVKRTNKKLGLVVVDKLFSMQQPEGDKKSYANAIQSNGDYVLMGLSSVKIPDAESSNGAKRNFIRTMGFREQTAMLKAIRDEADIEIFPENIK